MENMKIEKWLDHEIRFIEIDNEWWAISKDVAGALGYRDSFNMTRFLDGEEKGTHIVSTPGGNQEMTVISETGIYEASFNSRRQEAKAFKKWVKQLLKQLRQQSGLEGFQVFRMLDKEHQKAQMSKLDQLKAKDQTKFIKANQISNKSVSTKHGYPKLVKKADMTPEMLQDRQTILEDTANLMLLQDEFGLDISISEKIYAKHNKIGDVS